MSDQPRLDEQMIAQALQLGLASQMEEAEAVNIEVKTDLGKAVQGQADSVSVRGQGMVVQDLRVQELQVDTDRVALNPLSFLFGKPELDQPLDATARVVLTEADVNRALNHEQVLQRLPPLTLDVAGEAVTVTLQRPLQAHLLAGGRIQFAGTAQICKVSGTRSLRFTAGLLLCKGGLPLTIESFTCDPGQGITLALALSLLQKFQEILSLPALEIEGVVVQIRQVEVQAGSLTLSTTAQIRDLPTL